MLLGRVVDQDVQAAETLHGSTDRLATERLAAYVPGYPERARSELFDEADCLARVSVLVQIDDRHIRAFPGERDRHGAADAAVASRDQRNLAAQFPRAPGPRIVGLGPRSHARLDARLAALALGRSEGSLG
jgi:hypothetical protein